MGRVEMYKLLFDTAYSEEAPALAGAPNSWVAAFRPDQTSLPYLRSGELVLDLPLEG